MTSPFLVSCSASTLVSSSSTCSSLLPWFSFSLPPAHAALKKNNNNDTGRTLLLFVGGGHTASAAKDWHVRVCVWWRYQ
ncbi:hypothetical protein TRSC58_07501 [Trypanosoma rangeli SC58]|uniref:Uncharacterized protein n=1 Tax=Trypanosoma rangeli SC58 TaxID=429131 RepID=A0A061IT11_TRYRA|nr:hypothetical protein TRSC58_07501 [Trypanosoma rangeli SC58]